MFASPWADAPCRPQDVGMFLTSVEEHDYYVPLRLLPSLYQVLLSGNRHSFHKCS